MQRSTRRRVLKRHQRRRQTSAQPARQSKNNGEDERPDNCDGSSRSATRDDAIPNSLDAPDDSFNANLVYANPASAAGATEPATEPVREPRLEDLVPTSAGGLLDAAESSPEPWLVHLQHVVQDGGPDTAKEAQGMLRSFPLNSTWAFRLKQIHTTRRSLCTCEPAIGAVLGAQVALGDRRLACTSGEGG